MWLPVYVCAFFNHQGTACRGGKGLLCVFIDVITRPFVGIFFFPTQRRGVGADAVDMRVGVNEEIEGYDCLCKRGMFPHKTN